MQARSYTEQKRVSDHARRERRVRRGPIEDERPGFSSSSRGVIDVGPHRSWHMPTDIGTAPGYGKPTVLAPRVAEGVGAAV
jgi:hypothetical protein